MSCNTTIARFVVCLSLLAASVPSAFAGTVTKASTGADLTAGASWTGSAVPGSGDVAMWNSSSLGASLTMNSAQSWGGISITAALTDIGVTGSGTLTLGASGIDLSSSANNLTWATPIALGASQTWNVNSGKTLSVSGIISGSSMALTKSGAGTLTLSTNNTYTGATTLNQGMLLLDFTSLSSPNNVISSSSALTLNGGTLFLKGKSSGTSAQTFNGISVAGSANMVLTNTGYALLNFTGGSITRSGTGTLDITLPSFGTFTATVPGVNNGVVVDASGNWADFITVNGGQTWATSFGGNTLSDFNGPYLTFFNGSTLQTHIDFTTYATQPSSAFTVADLRFNADGVTLTLPSNTTNDIDAGGILVTPNAASTGVTIGGSGSLAGNGGGHKLTVFDYGKLTISAPISGTTAGATFTGPGTTTLNGTNTYTGGTTVAAGTLNISGSGSLGAGSYSGAINNVGTLTFSSSVAQTLAGPISGNGLLTVSGSTVTLSGTNTYTGGIISSNGQLNINSSTALGAAAGTFTIAGASTIDNTSGGAITLTNNNAQSWNADFTFAGSQGLNLGTGAVTLGGSRQVTVSANTLTVGGAIGGGYSLTKTGAGNLTLSGYNTYSGGTVVNGGTLTLSAGGYPACVVGTLTINSGALVELGAVDALGYGYSGVVASPVNIAGGTLDNGTSGNNGYITTFNLTGGTMSSTGGGGYNFNGSSSAINSLATNVVSTISGPVVLRANGVVITTAAGTVPSGIDLNISGVISDGGSGYNLTKAGPGTLALSGCSTFSGAVVVNGGTLYANPGGRVNSNAFSYVSSITVNSGATLRTCGDGLFGWDGTQTHPITVNAGGTMTCDTNGDVVVGVVTLNGGTLAGGPNTNWGSWSFGRAPTNQLIVTDNSLVTATNVVFYNGASISVSPNKTLTISGTVDNSLDYYDYRGASYPYSGQSSIIQTGSGTLVLSGTNTYTGGTTNAGTLTISGSGSLGSGSYSGAISNGGTMTFGSSVAQTLAGPVSGSGTLSVSGGTLTLAGTNTYTGGTTNAGTLTISGSGSLGAGSYSGAISNGGTMTFSSSVAQTLAGPISGNGLLKVSGSTVTLSGTNTFSGTAQVIGGGVLSVSSVSKALGNVSDINLGGSSANGTLLYTGSGETSDRVISYTAYNGSDYQPNQIIDQSGTGLLKFTSSLSQAGGRAHYLTLQGSTSGAGEIAGDISGSGAATTVVKNGTGTWTLSGNNAYTGGTLVNAGTLVVSNAAALGAAANLLTLASNATSVVLQVAANMTSPQATTLSGGADGASGTGSVIVDTLANRTAQLQMNPSAGPAFPGLIVRNQGLLALSGTNTFNYFFAGNSSLGGNLLITNGSFVVLQNSGNSKFDQGANVTIGSNAVFGVGSANGDAWFPLGDTAGTTNNMTLAGGSFIVTNVNGFQVARYGDAALTINSGSVLVNDATALGIVMSEGNGHSTINLNGGCLTPLRIRVGSGVEVFNFNGGTLAANASRTDFLPGGGMTPNVRNGGAVVDSAGFNITISQPLVHSTIAGDNAVDGGLTKLNSGTLTLSGTNTYTGGTVIAAGTLALSGGSISNSSSITVSNGATFDVSGVAGYTLGGSQTLYGSGTVNGSFNTTSGSKIYAGNGAAGVYATNTFNNNLTNVTGATIYMNLGDAYNGTNDQIVVGGTLALNSTVFHIRAPSTSDWLDIRHDYVLARAANVTGSASVSFDVAPRNASCLSAVVTSTNVLLHCTATSPTVTATASPPLALRNQSVTLTATVTPGSAPVTNVAVNLSLIGGGTGTLVQSNSSSLYTNTFTVAPSTAVGGYNLTVTVTDAGSQTGSATVFLIVNASTDVWNGQASNANWSSGSNWVGTLPPGYVGDSLIFSNNVNTSPNMDNAYNVNGLTFDSSAASFIIGSTYTLTLSGSIVNNSANPQTINTPVSITSAQTVNTASGNVTLGGVVSGGSLTKTGNNTLTLTNANTYTGGTTNSAGTITIGNNAALGTGTITMNGGTLADSGNAAYTVSNNIVATAGTTSYLNPYNGAGLTLAGNLSGSGNITVNGSGIALDAFYLAGTNSGFTGTLTVNNSSWQRFGFASASAGSANAAFVLNSAGTDEQKLLLGVNQTNTISFGSLSGSGWIRNDSVPSMAIIRVGDLNTSTTFSGLLTQATTGGVGVMSLLKVGTGTLTLSVAEPYTGDTTISAGTLALGAAGSISNSPNLILAAAGTFDVSAISTFNLSSSTVLKASGTGAAPGSTAATINGGGTVNFSTNALILNVTPSSFSGDTTHPALLVTNASLTLNNNAITITNAAATPLGAGIYRLVQVGNGSSGSISGTPNATPVVVAGSGIAAGMTAVLSVSSGNLNLNVQNNTTNTLALTSGSNPSTYGNSVTFSATISPAPTNGESVTFKDGATTLGTGTISAGVAAFSISTLTAGSHSITAVYSGDVTNAASTSAALAFNVNQAVVTVASGITANNKTYDGTTTATISSNNVVLSGVIAGDSANVNLSTNGYTATFASAPVGTNKTVTVSGLTLTGSAAGNYTLTQPTGLTANISSATVTITSGITANNKFYDGTTAATISSNNVALSGVASGDTINISTNGYTAVFSSASVGTNKTVTVSGLTLTGSVATNYVLTQPTLLANIATAQSGIWTNLASGSWNTAGNWTNSLIAGGMDATANFSSLALTGNVTVTVDGARTIGNLSFGDTGQSHNWTLAPGTGDPLMLAVSAGQPTITTASGSNVISAVLASTLASAGITKTGNGTLCLSAANLLTNAVNNINGGTLVVANNNALGYTNSVSGGMGTNIVASGATLQVAYGVQCSGQVAFLAGSGLGGTNGALYANAGTGNQQNTRWSYQLNSIATPAIVLTSNATIRVDGSGYPMEAGFLVGAITNNTSGLAYTLTVTGTGELRVDAPAEIAVASINVSSGVLGLNGTGPGNITRTQMVTVASGAALACRRTNTFNASGSTLTLNGILDLNYNNPGAASNVPGNSWWQLIGSLQGGGTITNSSQAPQILYVASGTSNSIFNGTVNPGTNGAITLCKQAQNTAMWLNGNATFNGTNLVIGGIEYIDGAWNPTNGGFVVTPGSGATTATLAGNGSTYSPISLTTNGSWLSAGDPSAGGGTLTVSNVTGSGGIVMSNASLTVLGALGGSSAYLDSIYLTNGTLQMPLGATAAAFATNLTIDGAVTLKFTNSVTAGQYPMLAYSSLGGLAGFGGLSISAPSGLTVSLSNNVANHTIDAVVTYPQTITFPSPGDQTYGVAPITLNATASSGLAVSYAVVSGPATVSSNVVTITGAGTVTVQASQAGSATWSPATPVSQTISVSAATLTVTANNTNRVYGAPNPSFTASYTGFVSGENQGVLSGAPALGTTANATSTVAGSPYNITVTNGTLIASNYTFAFVAGQLTITAAGSSNAVSSSANPSPTGSNVTFTATLTTVAPGTGTPTGTVQFLADGSPLGLPVTLASGVASLTTNSLSHGTHSIAANYAGDGNFSGSTNSLSTNELIDAAPVIAGITLQRYPNCGDKIRVTGLLTNATDPENDALTLISVGTNSAAGGTVSSNATWIIYEPPAGLTNADSFTFVMADSYGLQTTGTVSVVIINDTGFAQNIDGIDSLAGNSLRIRFSGIPLRKYSIQYAQSLVSPVWQGLGTTNADAFGEFNFNDTPPQGQTQYYRSTYP